METWESPGLRMAFHVGLGETDVSMQVRLLVTTLREKTDGGEVVGVGEGYLGTLNFLFNCAVGPKFF